jgi:ketosteroid isomerase-like protein
LDLAVADNVELVRRLWTAFERGGIEAVLEIADPDVRWEPYGAGGAGYDGHDGLRAYMEERRARGEQTSARLYSAVAKGEFVVARGEVQIKGEQGTVTMQPSWLYEFRDGRLTRFRGFRSQEEAMRAAGLASHDPTAAIRDLLESFNQRQSDRLRELVADDCEWDTYVGVSARGPDAIRVYVDDVFGAARSVAIADYSLRQIGESIAVSGSLNVTEANGAFAQRQIHWVFQVRDGKIARARSFAHREEAVAAAEAAAG